MRALVLQHFAHDVSGQIVHCFQVPGTWYEMTVAYAPTNRAAWRTSFSTYNAARSLEEVEKPRGEETMIHIGASPTICRWTNRRRPEL